MPANLSPEYKAAHQAFRRAHEPSERLECLREMLRTIPKHKGTEHLQADLRTRIKELTEELTAPRKGAARGGPVVVVRHEGAGQVALLGPPNAGKSALHARLTGSHALVGPYPFATKLPLPGMLRQEDVSFQLVDLPPVSSGFMEPWMPNALQSADAALIVVDLGDPDCIGEVVAIRRRLAEKHVFLLEAGGPAAGPDGAANDDSLDLFHLSIPAVLLANKSDLLEDPAAELLAFRELAGFTGHALTASAETGSGLEQIGPLLFDLLEVVRVYPKVPGHPPDRDRPFTLRRGGCVRDVAILVHRGRAADLKFARVWSSGKFDGEQVSPDHRVLDRDVVELHW